MAVAHWLASAAALPLVLLSLSARCEEARVNSIKETIERMQTCWRPPPASRANPMDITVIVSFNRSGQIMGKPRITFESPEATDNDRLEYRIAVMEALQRCTPMPFTESMSGAAAGHPFWIRFSNSSSKPATPSKEKRAWLIPITP